MKKQKIAVFLSSLMMLSILVPAMAFAAKQQTGTLEIEGTSDLFYEGYNTNGTGNPEELNFKTVQASSQSQTVRLADKDTPTKNVDYGDWQNKQFVGVIHLNNEETFKIKASSDGKFEDGAKQFTAVNFGVVTGTGIEELEGDMIEINYMDGSIPGTYPFIYNSALTEETPETGEGGLKNRIYYHEFINSGYTYEAGTSELDFEAPNNINSNYDPNATGLYTSIISGGTTLLESKTGTSGIFGVGVDYKLEIPANIAQGTYSTTITYDLTTDDVPQP